MKKIIYFVYVCLLLLMHGCAGVDKDLIKLPDVQPDKALVYFYREYSDYAWGTTFPVYEEVRGKELAHRKIGALKIQSFFFVEIEPGIHYYTSDKDQFIQFNAEAGKTYFIKGVIKKKGIILGIFYMFLDGSNETEAMPKIKNFKHVVPDE